MIFNLGEKICFGQMRGLFTSRNFVISFQNKVSKYHTKGHEQVYCLFPLSKFRPTGIRLYIGTSEE